jgi:hypothetical protein
MFAKKDSKATEKLQSICTWEFHCNECGKDFEANEKYFMFELTNGCGHPCCLACKPRVKDVRVCEERVFTQDLIQLKEEENKKIAQNIMLLRKNFLEKCPWFGQPKVSVSIRSVKTELTPLEKRRRRAMY